MEVFNINNEKIETNNIKIDNNLSIKIVENNIKKEKVDYIITNNNDKVIKKFIKKELPNTLGNNTDLFRYILKYIPTDDVAFATVEKYGGIDNYKKERVTYLLNELQEDYYNILDNEDEKRYNLEALSLENKASKLLEAKKYYNKLNNPLLWIGSITDWLVADERENVLLAFLCNVCTVVLGEPISTIFHGDATKGKTNIQKIALSYILDDYVLFEKKCTEATIFRRAEENVHYYENKIINFGDMGGANDLHDVENPKALLKELQSDGFLNRPITIKSGDGNFEVVDLELKGKPSLSYTTVPSYDFDDQEKSRSLFITPRDNMSSFRLFNKHTSIEGKTFKKQKDYEKLSNLIKYIVEYIKEEIYDNLNIINPYNMIIADYVRGTLNEKRDIKKYNNIAKCIALINHNNHKIYTINGENTIFVTKDDINLLFGLLNDYKTSIHLNISKGAYTVLKDIHNNYEKWSIDAGEEYYDIAECGLNVNDYINNSKINTYSKASVGVYFSELNKNGYIETINKGRNGSYRYILTDKYDKDIEVDININDDDKKWLAYELGENIKEFLDNDELTGVNINDVDNSVEIPIWSNNKHNDVIIDNIYNDDFVDDVVEDDSDVDGYFKKIEADYDFIKQIESMSNKNYDIDKYFDDILIYDKNVKSENNIIYNFNNYLKLKGVLYKECEILDDEVVLVSCADNIIKLSYDSFIDKLKEIKND